MNLDELRQAMASDATIENEQLKNEINLLREQLNKTKSEYEKFKKYMTNDCRVLANRCWTLTGGTTCCFCVLDEFKCPHAWSDEKKIEAAKIMRREFDNAKN